MGWVLSPSERTSRTARAAALGRAIGFDGHHDPLAEQILPWRDAVLARRLRHRLGGDHAGPAGRLLRTVAGGLVAHTTLRMLAIDRAVREAVDAGVEQVAIVGAGLDTRAWRLPELAEVQVFEVDLPDIQREKRLRLGGTPPRAHDVCFVAADLHRADLDWVLADAGHDRAQPTLWVWEAVAPYLERPAVEATIATLGRRSNPGSRLAMTFVVPDLVGTSLPGRVLEPGARVLFDLLGEPLHTLLDDAEVVALLEAAGFDRVTVSDFAAWARDADVDPPRNPLAAERLAVARAG